MINEKELDQTFYEIQVKGYLDSSWTQINFFVPCVPFVAEFAADANIHCSDRH